jgi:4-aminobutyrate aminotransferase
VIGPRTRAALARDDRLISSALKMRYAPMVVAGGEGARLVDADGRRFLDFGGGWALAALGYSDHRVRDAVARQVARTTFGGLISAVNEPALDLAEKLTGLLPGDWPKKAWFGFSGSDASEAALRMVAAATGRPRVVSFHGSWHGTSDGARAISGHPAFAAFAGGGLALTIPFPDPYRNPFGDQAGDPTDRCLAVLEDHLAAAGGASGDIGAVFVETIQSDAGDIVPPPAFLPRLRALCDRCGVMLVIDDVKVGLGRTGRMLSFEHAGVAPDLVLLGKSLGGGLPLSAVVGRAEVLDAVPGGALFTAVGNATGCAAGLAVVAAIEEDGLAARAARVGDHLRRRLEDRLLRHPVVGDIRGQGLIVGVDLVTERASKQPNQPLAAKVVYRAWELGLVLYYAGNHGNVLEITPPLIIDEADADEGASLLDQAIADVLDGRVSDEAVAPFAGW